MSVEGNTVHDLQHAIREVRIAQSERSDVVVDLREAERTRLDLLAETLQPVASDVPEGHDEFALAVLPGDPPRYWVDATAFVMMGRDKRTYRFLRDTRLGRTVIGESGDVDSIARMVTHYVAERIVEKERALSADWAERREPETSEAQKAEEPRRRPRGGAFWAVAGFLLGLLSGAFLLLAYAWVSVG